MNAPREFVELPRGMRERIEGAIESLITLLDAIDGDTDCEDAEPEEQFDDEGHDTLI
jgi:hypothetical protein